jgi:predicted transcriptional regulator
MAVISIRLNDEEQKKIEYLADFFNEEKSTLIKHSINEMYEDIVDREVIRKYETKDKKKKTVFINSEAILQDIS